MKKTIKHKIVDYIFWIVFLLFTNPGGILQALGFDNGSGGINITDILYVILVFCFLRVFDKSIFLQDKSFIKAIKFLIVFVLYYIIVFSFFVPIFKNNPFYSPVTTFIKIRYSIINCSMVPIVYLFLSRSTDVFIRLFLTISIVVIILFLITVAFGVEILPYHIWKRGFVKIDRIIMVNYGLLPVLIPMGVSVLVFKFKIKIKREVLLVSFLMYVVWILAIFRRFIFGAIVLYFLNAVFYNYINNKKIVPIKKLANAVFYFMIIIFILNMTFPKYVDAGVEAVYQTIYVIQHGETTNGLKDVRMGAGKQFMQDKINENWVFGTGFDDRWRTGDGDEAGFEASDYPFLAAIATNGIVGMLFFLPVYFLLINLLIKDVKYLKNKRPKLNTTIDFLFITFITYTIYDIIQYMNWFSPVSLFSILNGMKWYVFFGMYLATRRLFYFKEIGLNSNLLVRNVRE